MKGATNTTYLNHPTTYYRWTTTDPVLAEICDMIIKSGLTPLQISTKIQQLTHSGTISPQTISNWLSGKVRRPHNWSVTWIAYALGYERKWMKIN